MAVKNVIFRLQAETGKLRKDLDEVKKQLAGINENTQQVDKSFNGLTGTIRKVGVALGGLAVGRELLQFGNSAIQAAADFEALEISFTTFLGSADEAKKVLADLEEFSVSTPFTPEQVQTAGKALLAFGVEAENLETSLQRIGDLSAGTGKDFNELAVIFGKAKVQGTLFAEDINQLTEAGIPVIQEFAKQFGVTEGEVKKLGSEGKITFANLEQAFGDLTGEGGKFFNLTKNLSESTAGRISTLQGEFGKLKREIGEALLPIFETLVGAARSLINTFSNFGTFLDENRGSVVVFTSALGFLIGALTRKQQVEIAGRISTVASNVANRAASIITKARTTAVAALTLANRRQTVAQKAATLATISGRKAIQLLNVAIRSNPIGLLISGLSLVAGLFLDFGDSAASAADDVADVTDETIEFESAQKSLNTVNEETNKRVAEESAELKGLIEELKNTNANSKERKKLIDSINSTYGLTLKNLKTEKEFVEQLDRAYAAFVSRLKERILLEAKQKELTRLIEQQILLEQQIEGRIGSFLGESIGKSFAGLGNQTGAAVVFELNSLLKATEDELDRLFKGERIKVGGVEFQTPRVTREQLEQFSELNDEQREQFRISLDATLKTQSDFWEDVNDANNAQYTEFKKDELARAEDAAKTIRIPTGTFSKETGEEIFETIRIEDFETIIARYDGVNEAIKALEGAFTDFDFDGFTGGASGSANKVKSILLDLQRELRKTVEQTETQRISFIDPNNLAEAEDKLQQSADKQREILNAALDDREADAKKAGQLNEQTAAIFALIRAEKLKQIEEKLQDDLTKIREEAERKRQENLQEIEDVNSDTRLVREKRDLKKLTDERRDLEREFIRAKTRAEEERIQDEINLNAAAQRRIFDRQLDIQIEAINRRREFELQSEELTAEERILINKNADLEILKLRNEFSDRVKDFNLELTEDTEKKEQERKEAVLEGIEEILEASVELANKLIDLQIQQTENAISAQERRVERAKELADKGNAELLQAEEKRLEELNKQRQKFVQAQQALAATELVINSVVAVSKAAAEGGAAAPFTIAATLIALAAGLVAAKAQAQAAAGGFAEGGYTGDGGKYDPAGTVHKGEFVFTKEKTAKYRPLFEAIHKGRNPFLMEGISEQAVIVNNFGFDQKLERIEKAIKKQNRLSLHIDEKGIRGIVSRMEFKENRIKSKAKK